jgi:hypothetical protein
VLDLTRLGRDTRELLAIVEDDLHANGRHFRTLDRIVLDTSGDMIFTVFAGRPRALTSEQIADSRIMLSAGQARTAVAAKPRVSRWTLSGSRQQEGEAPPGYST